MLPNTVAYNSYTKYSLGLMYGFCREIDKIWFRLPCVKLNTIKPMYFSFTFWQRLSRASVIFGCINTSKRQEYGNMMVAMQVSYSVVMRDQSQEYNVTVYNGTFLSFHRKVNSDRHFECMGDVWREYYFGFSRLYCHKDCIRYGAHSAGFALISPM